MRNRIYAQACFRFSLLLLPTFLIACQAPPDPASRNNPASPPIVQIVPSQNTPEKRIISTLNIPQPNCGGSQEVTSTIDDSYTFTYIMQVGGSLEVDGSGRVGIPAVGEVEVGTKVAAQYGVSYGQQVTHSRSITLKAKEGTDMRHTVQRVEYWETGSFIITTANQTIQYPYSFRRDFQVELINSVNLDNCPSGVSQNPNQNQPTVNPSPTDATIAPSQEVEVTCPIVDNQLGAGKRINITMNGGCYYHFNVACAGCRAGQEDNYVVYYTNNSVTVTVPEGAVWLYSREPNRDEVCSDPVDRWPKSLPRFLNVPGVQQIFPCGG